MKTELSAYINKTNETNIVKLLKNTIHKLTQLKIFGDDKCLYKTFEDENLFILLTIYDRVEYKNEALLTGNVENTILYSFNNIQFGEWIVDNLNCEVLVDCDGKYSHPLSDDFIRVTKDKLEIVVHDDDDNIDEVKTELIKLR